jgi:MoaA/NifB/PqqE/SkfB family radical SAM enzyme
MSMESLTLFPTNRCHQNCLHCFQNKADPRAALPLELAEEILSQARGLGFGQIDLTGGEVVLHPQLEELLRLIVAHGFTFRLMTSGYLFPQRLFPLLTDPEIGPRLRGVCFSLDGARAETHEALRGPGTFQEVLAAATLCKDHKLPFGLKSMITTYNREELTQMALLAASLGAGEHVFNSTIPTPRLIEAGAILSPEELDRTTRWIGASLAGLFTTKITIAGYTPNKAINSCPHLFQDAFLDFQGNFILCCDLAFMGPADGSPTQFGAELLGNLKEISFKEGLRRHFQAAARLAEARLNNLDQWQDRPFSLCYWCYRHFGKLEWLKNYPDSPWAAGLLESAVQAAN